MTHTQTTSMFGDNENKPIHTNLVGLQSSTHYKIKCNILRIMAKITYHHGRQEESVRSLMVL